MMRKAIVGASILALFLGGVSPALGAPLAVANVSSYGLQLTGLVALPPTPRVAVATVPAIQEEVVLNVPAQPVVTSATLKAFAQTAVDATLPSTLPTGNILAFPRGAALPPSFNARGHAIVEDLAAVVPSEGAGALVKADVLEAEAAVSCVGTQPVFAVGSRIVGLNVAGTDLGTPVNDVLNQVIDLTNGLPLPLKIIRNETGVTADGGVFVNALRVIVGEGTDAVQDIIVSHAEVSAAACAAEAPLAAGPQPPAELPLTGGDLGLLPPLGLLAGAATLRRVVTRLRAPSHR